MSQGEVVKSGYLTKSPPEGRAAIAHWHRRWFVFSDSLLVYPLAKRYVRMEYYQSEEDAKKLKDPKGRDVLNNCCIRIPCGNVRRQDVYCMVTSSNRQTAVHVCVVGPHPSVASDFCESSDILYLLELHSVCTLAG